MAGSIESLSFSKGGEWYHLMDLRYITSHLPQECKDADCPSPVPGAWTPELLGFWSDVTVESTGSCRFHVQLAFNKTLHEEYGAPATVLVAYELDPAQKRLSATLTWQNKTSTRLPEALTVFSRPSFAGHRWAMDSVGEWVTESARAHSYYFKLSSLQVQKTC